MNGSANGTVYMAANGATVNVNSVTGTLTVSDSEMFLRTVEGNAQTVGASDPATEANVITLTNVKNVVVTEGIVWKTDSDNRYPVNEMYLSGTAGKVDNNTASNVGITAGKIMVTGEYTLNKVPMTVAAGAELYVTGTVYVNDSQDSTCISGMGTMTVTGTVDSVTALHGETLVINAVMYEKMVETVNHYIYTNLAAAIASGETDLTVLGDLYILEDTTIPAGVSINAEGNNVYVGYEDVVDVTLTVADGGELIAKWIYVNGTMVVEDIDTGVEAVRIYSDTSTVTETSGLYTNIYNALNSAADGDVVTITNIDGIVVLDRSVEVKNGVKLEIPVNKTLVIEPGVVLSVAGTVDNKGTVTAGTVASGVITPGEFGTEPKDDAGKEYAVITVTGTIVSSTEMSSATYKIPGAYYVMKNRFYITTVENAASVITETDGYTVDIHGKISAGTVAFAGTADKPVIVNVEACADLTVDSMTVAHGKINVAVGAQLDGSYGTASGSVAFTNMKAAAASVFDDRTVASGDSDVQRLYVSGSYAVADNKKACSVEFSGEVYVATLTIDAEYTDKKNGAVTVADGSDVVVSGSNSSLTVTDFKVTVAGTLTTINGGQFKAAENSDDSTVIVLGTLNVAAATEKTTAGLASINELYIGGEKNAEAAANVSGTMTLNHVWLFPGCTVAEDTAKILDDAKSTEFYVEDDLWMTAYDVGTSDWNFVTGSGDSLKNVIKPTGLTDSLFSTWLYDDRGVMKSIDTETAVGAYDKVYALIDYEIYTVTVFADPGVNAVYIDGVLMTSGYFDHDGVYAHGFQATVVAGNHKIEYKLDNGFSGEATMTVNGTQASGLSFTCSGTDADDRAITILLQGIEKSGFVPDSPDAPAETDDGLTITDYLLIVLVVLIVVMAIIVAMRLMRS